MAIVTSVPWDMLRPDTASLEQFVKVTLKNNNLNLPVGFLSQKLGYYLRPINFTLYETSIKSEDDLGSLVRDFYPGEYRLDAMKADEDFRRALLKLRQVF